MSNTALASLLASSLAVAAPPPAVAPRALHAGKLATPVAAECAAVADPCGSVPDDADEKLQKLLDAHDAHAAELQEKLHACWQAACDHRWIADAAGVTLADATACGCATPGLHCIAPLDAPASSLAPSTAKSLAAVASAVSDWCAPFAPPGVSLKMFGGPPNIAAVASSSVQPFGAPLVEGTASFVGDRAQTELLVWLADEVGGRICADASWFPQTCALLKDSARLFQPNQGVLFVAAVRADLQGLPFRIAFEAISLSEKACANDQGCKAAVALANRDLAQWGGSLATFVTAAKNGESPIGLLKSWKTELGDLCAKAPPLPAARTIREVACVVAEIGSLVEQTGDAVLLVKNGADPSDLDDALARLAARYAETLQFGGELCAEPSFAALPILARTCGKPPAAPDDLKNKLSVFLKDISWLEKQLLDGKKARDGSFTYVSALIERTAQVIDDATALFLPDAEKKVGETLKLALAIVRAGLEIAQGRFSDGVRDALTPLLQIDDQRLPHNVQRYLTLVVDLATAKNPIDVRNILNSAAAPVGSWRTKRDNRAGTWSITALAGGSAGYETPVDGSLKLRGGLAAGAFVPVGVDAAWPLGGSNWTLGVFHSLIDVGQLAWARVTATDRSGSQQSADTASDVGILDVLSPGAYLRVGAGKTPFTFGAGVSIAPALRKYFYTTSDAPAGTNALLTMWRFNLFLAVDVTLFPF